MLGCLVTLCVSVLIWNMMLWLSSCVGLCHVPLKVLTKCNVIVMVPGTVRRVRCSWPLAELLSVWGGAFPSVPVLAEDGPMSVCAQLQGGERLLCDRSVHHVCSCLSELLTILDRTLFQLKVSLCDSWHSKCSDESDSGWGHLGALGVTWEVLQELKVCIYTLFMPGHSLQLIDYERVCPIFIHYFRLGSYYEEFMWKRLFYLKSTCMYIKLAPQL